VAEAARPPAAAPVAASSASASPERLDALPGRDLPGGLRVAEAHTRAARLKGLAKLDAMPASTALHIPKCWSVHTFTMRFPLDLIWLDRHGRVVRVDENVPPRRVRTCVRARSVVETNAGASRSFLDAGLGTAAR
jgi:uncharacterized membrane protein (UPF0127 family)